MVITTDDFVKIALTLSVAFALVGIAVQLIRILGELVHTVQEGNLLLKLVFELMQKVTEDYDYIADLVKSTLESINGFTNTVFVPLAKMFGFLGKLEGMPFMFGFKAATGGKKKKQAHNRGRNRNDSDEDYADEEDSEAAD